MNLPNKKYIQWIGNDCYLTIDTATRHNTFGVRSGIISQLQRRKGTLFVEILDKAIKKKYHWGEIEKKEIVRLRSGLQSSQYDKPYYIHQFPIAGPTLDDPVEGQEELIRNVPVDPPKPIEDIPTPNYDKGKSFVEEAKKMLNERGCNMIEGEAITEEAVETGKPEEKVEDKTEPEKPEEAQPDKQIDPPPA